MVVRYQGGANAGHTITIGKEVFALHLLPSGVLRKGIISVIGNGLVIDPEALENEIRTLERSGRTADCLRISDRANVVMPYHKALDGAEEKNRGTKGVGTTGRGIGPCYSDKVARSGIRMCDLLDKKLLEERLSLIIPIKEKLIGAFEAGPDYDKAALIGKLLEYGEKYREIICDTSVLVNDAIRSGKKVMFEGAQGTMLDIDYGTYPFVTSSNCTSAGICTGVGVPPSAVREVIGVTKAYTTRVGAGPFPTELKDETGKMLMNKGGEFGTTTGRSRRCGWLDMVVVRHAVMLNGMTSIALTKLDVLNGLKKVLVCVAYDIDGERVVHIPANISRLEKARPVYEEFDGWGEFPEDAGNIAKKGLIALPKEMREYLRFIAEDTGVEIGIISIGKRRDQTIDLRSNRWS